MRDSNARTCLRVSRTLFALVYVIVCAVFAGCDNSCVIIVSNPGGQPFPNPPTCSSNKATANVNLDLHSASAPPSVLGNESIQHIYVTIRGVQAHPNETADADSPDWVDFAPELASRSVQVDLLAAPRSSCATGSLGEHIVVAGVYRQFRLQLVSSLPTATAPRGNACGNAGFQCTVTSEGAVRPLVFDAAQPVIHLASDRISGGFVRILPDSHATIALEFNPFASSLRPTATALRLDPVFTLAVRPSCDSTAP
jgi:Domain of unknown function (DUF4382)